MSLRLPSIDRCWFLTGPTASGKSAVGLELAQRLGGEIISLDSMALYRGMNIGTAKPTASERQLVPHHLIDVIDPLTGQLSTLCAPVDGLFFAHDCKRWAHAGMALGKVAGREALRHGALLSV